MKKSLKWYCQLRSVSIFTPKYLTLLVRYSLFQRNSVFKSPLNFFWLDLFLQFFTISVFFILHLTKTKSTKTFSELNNPKDWKVSESLLTWYWNKTFFCKFTENILAFLTNQVSRFFSCGIVFSYFSENLLLSFLLWHDFKITSKSRGRGALSCMATLVNVKQKKPVNWKLNVRSFIFWIWTVESCLCLYLKVSRKCQNLHCF